MLGLVNGCKTQANFGYEEAKAANVQNIKMLISFVWVVVNVMTLDVKHGQVLVMKGKIQPDVINMKMMECGMINVDDPKCIVCGKISTYGFLGNTSIHCAVHANKRVELYRPTRRCKCKQLATYGK